MPHNDVESMPALTREERGTGFATNMAREAQFEWRIIDEPGEFLLIPKALLNIDYRYQRDRVSRDRLATIRKNFSWKSCGVILVARRPDGSLWVFDGQHRVIAGKQLASIEKMPCMVYDCSTVEAEALAFLGSNTVRGAMTMHAKYKSMKTALVPIALTAEKLIADAGYTVRASKGDWNIACIGTLISMLETDMELATSIFELTVNLFEGKYITKELLGGLFYLERNLRLNKIDDTLFNKNNLVSLSKAGVEGLDRKIAAVKAYRKVGGEKICAQGITDALNFRRTIRRLPELYGAVGVEPGEIVDADIEVSEG